MKHDYKIQYENILLRQISKDDLCLLKEWRNDKANSVYLRKIDYITDKSQELWYEKYLNDVSEIGFSIVETRDLNRIIGSVFLYNLDFERKECEAGKILIGDKEAHGRGIGRTSFVMALEFGFKDLNLKRIYASVNQANIAAHSNYMRIGFKIIGSHPFHQNVDGYEDEIEINQEKLEKVNLYSKDIVIVSN